MNSKEALEKLLEMAIENGLWKSGLVEDLENTIKQDIDRLEKLEKENRKQLSTILDLDIENRTLKQAIEILKDTMQIRFMNDCFQIKGKHNDKWYFVREFNLLEEKELVELLKEVLQYD